ncbi:MAG: hypothetical protein RIC55_04370 [Pirellulaceae bacterium]
MIVSKCPYCREAVTIPDAPRQSRARCPLCMEQYTLAEALERCPPVLELIDAPSDSDDGFVGGYPLAAAGAGFDSAYDADDAPPSFDFAEDPAPGGVATATAAKSTGKPSSASSTASAATSVPRRPRKKAKNPAIEIAKVVVGGVLGLSIAQLLLWWLPFNLNTGQRDPTSLGRNIGPYVPWIVPAQVRGVEPAEANAGQGSGEDKDAKALQDDSVWGQAARDQRQREQNGGRPPRQNNNQGRQGAGNGNKGGGQPNRNKPPAGNPSANNTSNTGLGGIELPGVAVLPGDPLGGGESPFGKEENLLDPEILVDPEAVDPEAVDPKAGATTPKPPKGGGKPTRRTSGWKSPGKRTADDVAAAIEAARSANEAYDSAPSDAPAAQRIGLANALYASLAELGLVLGHIDPQELPTVQPHVGQLNEFLTSLGDNKFNGLSYLASKWLADSDRANNGVALVGTIESIEPIEGDYYRTRLKTGDNTTQIVGWVSPQTEFRPGARVLVLGVIVDSPVEKLIAFNGSPTQVVCGSFSQVLKAAPKDDTPEGESDPEAN